MSRVDPWTVTLAARREDSQDAPKPRWEVVVRLDPETVAWIAGNRGTRVEIARDGPRDFRYRVAAD